MKRECALGEPGRVVYLDYAATSPLDPRVLEAMLPYFSAAYGNSHSGHRFGRAAERAIEDARESIAALLGCAPGEIVFTSGGTESDNLAVRGAAAAGRAAGKGAHLVTSAIEHSAVSRTVEQMATAYGYERTILPVDRDGRVDPEDLAEALREDTTLVSVMLANNEVGTVQPIEQMAAQAHARGALFHTDAVQAAGQMTLDVRALGVDMLSLSAHKFYGPKGVGLLVVREGVELITSSSGGSHEDGRRGGTLNTPGIVGMAAALRLACEAVEERTAHYRRLRDQLISGVLAHVSGAVLTGHARERLPNLASFAFDGVDGSILLMHLDMKGVAASSASACKTGNPEPSGVLLAMGLPHDLAMGSLRLTVGHGTTDEDVAYAVETIAVTVDKLRRLRAQA